MEPNSSRLEPNEVGAELEPGARPFGSSVGNCKATVKPMGGGLGAELWLGPLLAPNGAVGAELWRRKDVGAELAPN